MLRINKNELNYLYCTVTENTTISDANYLMEVISNDNHTSKVVRFTGDTSNNPIRWNRFKVREDSTEDLENSIISLDVGSFDYNIYQTSGTTGTSIVGLKRVESGLLKVIGSGDTISTIGTGTTIETHYNGGDTIITFE